MGACPYVLLMAGLSFSFVLSLAAHAQAPVPAQASVPPSAESDQVEQREVRGFLVETRIHALVPTGFYKTRYAKRDESSFRARRRQGVVEARYATRPCGSDCRTGP